MGVSRTSTFIVFQLVFMFLSIHTKAFNLDVMWPLVFTAPEDNSLFGFSVALHQEGTRHMLLVGAPHSRASDGDDIEREGGFYKCDIDDMRYAEPCDVVELDSERGQPVNDRGHQIGDKSNSFLGATVRSAGPDGPVLVCAPSYVWYIVGAQRPDDQSTSREPVGRCFIAQNNFTQIEKYEPCLQPNDKSTWYESKLTHCQAGTGGDISSRHVLVGGPGSFYWQGQIFRQDVNQQELPQHTWEGPLTFDDSYRGYTVLMADLNDDGELDNLVGTPRAPNMFGEVSVYDHNLVSIYNRSGHQLGEYFGNSLAATDLNGDGKNDLIVGAPMYTDEEQRTTNYEIGRIYIFYQLYANGESRLSRKKTIVGRHGRSRFGFSLTALGDINKDGFNDLAVGAPYDGDGAVYIFSGGRRGIVSTPVQVVRPSQLGITGHPLSGFGFSLSGERDIDENSYTDLAVGAHTSSHAVVLRARPVIAVTPSITFSVENIDLEKPNFNLTNNVQVPGFEIRTCIQYSGKGVTSNLPFQFHLSLDAVKTVSSRAFITFANGTSFREISWKDTLSKDEPYCYSFKAYVEKVIRDKLSPVVFQFSYGIEEDQIALMDGELLPILGNANTFVTEQLVLLKNCSNERCLPDLRVGINHELDQVIVGKTEMLFVDVDFQNNGDEAFEARLHARIPNGVSYIRAESKSSDLLVDCQDTVDISGNANIACDVGNPVPSKHTIPFRLQFEISLDDKESEHLHIHFHANSSNIDDDSTIADNTVNASIPIMVLYDLSFYGYANPAQLVYNTNDSIPDNVTSEADVGKEVIHFYIFQNQGPSDIGRSVLKVQWPMYTVEKDYLLYLTSVTPSKGECTFEEDVNPEKLKLLEIFVNVSRDEAARQGNDRVSREIKEKLPTPQPLMMIDCDTGKCVEISCEFDTLGGNEQPFVLSIRSRLWLKTLLQSVEEGQPASDWVITSRATLEVKGSAYTLANDLPGIFMENATTTALPESELSFYKTPFPWWAYLLAALIGFTVLSCLIMTAWRCGFFKRKKIGDETKLAE